MTLTELPTPLRSAVYLLGAETAGAVAIAVFVGYQGVAAEPTSLADALALAGFVAVIAVALAGLAVALTRRKARARAPAIVLQLLAVMFAYVLITAGLAWLGVPVALIGIATATLLLAPSTGEALGE